MCNYYINIYVGVEMIMRDRAGVVDRIGVSIIYEAEQDSVESNHKRTPIKLCMLCNSLLIC